MQRCEAPACDTPAEFTADSPTPGGTIHLCAEHYEWTAHHDQRGQCVNCGETKTGTTYVSRAAGGAFCAECYTDGDKAPSICAMIMENGSPCGAVAVVISRDGYPFCDDCARWGL